MPNLTGRPMGQDEKDRIGRERAERAEQAMLLAEARQRGIDAADSASVKELRAALRKHTTKEG